MAHIQDDLTYLKLKKKLVDMVIDIEEDKKKDRRLSFNNDSHLPSTLEPRSLPDLFLITHNC